MQCLCTSIECRWLVSYSVDFFLKPYIFNHLKFSITCMSCQEPCSGQSLFIGISFKHWGARPPKSTPVGISKKLPAPLLLSIQAQVCCFAQRNNIPVERFMLPASEDRCSIRISELLNSFQPWRYYLIWGRVTTCLPPLYLQMFRLVPGLIHFMMTSKCQSISLIVVCVCILSVGPCSQIGSSFFGLRRSG